MNYFNELNNINVNDHVEQKNGLSYLSWAWAWAELKKKYPLSFYTIYEDSRGLNYFTDGTTAYVKTGVTVVDGEMSLEHIEYLPIMNLRNKSIPLDEITSFDVNKSIQRSLTKAVARHGLGLYIYAGEDLPEEEKANKKPLSDEILAECKELGIDLANVAKYLKKSVEALTEEEVRVCVERKKRSKKGETKC